MSEVVINSCFGGFGLSLDSERAYYARKGQTAFFYRHKRDAAGDLNFESYERVEPGGKEFFTYTVTKDLGPNPTREDFNEALSSLRDVPRDDRDLVAVVKELGDEANGAYAALNVVSVPDGAEWQIEEYDGYEHVAEKHRTWS